MEPITTTNSTVSPNQQKSTANDNNSSSTQSSQQYIYEQLDPILLSDKIRTMNCSTNSSSHSPYMNHDAFAAQVRTIMKAAGLIPDKLSSHKMTLMAELFASEDEDGDVDVDDDDEEIYDDVDYIEEPIDIEDEEEEEQHERGNVDYEDEDDEDVEEEDLRTNRNATCGGAEDADDEEDNSEVESFTLEEDLSLDHPNDAHGQQTTNNVPTSPCNNKDDVDKMQFSLRDNLNASSNVDHFPDPELYHELQFTSSDVHSVLDEVGATIARMRISDNHQMPCLTIPPNDTTSPRNLDPNSTTKDMCKNYNLVSESGVTSSYDQSTTDCNDSTFLKEPTCGILEEFKKQNNLDFNEKNGSTVSFSVDDLNSKDVDKLLLYAANLGCFEMVEFLLKNPKIDVNKCGPKETTPLMEAASSGHLDIVCLLLDNGADINFKSSQGNTALMYAAATGHVEIAQYFVEKGANIEDQNENGHTALMEAASAGHVDVVRYLVSQGGSINVHSNEYKETALTLAAYKGHTEMVRYLIEIGSDLLHRGEEMHTALMEASMDGHVEVARLLLDSGAQVNMPPDSFESPLTLAACGGHVELALLLLERGANIEEVNDEGYTALMEASREGHEEMVALLILHGAKINSTTEDSKETALLMACGAGSLEVVNLLIKAGADLEIGANTPLIESAQEGHYKIVKVLLDAGAKINATNNSGETALALAAENGYVDIVKLLIASGADVDHCFNGGRTPLMKAAQSGRTEILSMLIASKANVNRSTVNNECTPLSLACANGHTETVDILLNAGADLYHRLKDNSTMLMEAAKNGHVDVVEMLLQFSHHYRNNNYNGSQQSVIASSQQAHQVTGNNRHATIPNIKHVVQDFQKTSNSTSARNSSRILPPCSKMQKKMSSSQQLPSHIKLVNNVTNVNSPLKVYQKPTSLKKTNPTTNDFKASHKFYIPPDNKKSVSPPQSGNFIMNSGTTTAASSSNNSRVKSCRSLSDSYLSSNLLFFLPNDDMLEECSLPSSIYAPNVVSDSCSHELSEHFKQQCENVGKKNSDVYGQMIASLFFSIFHSFLKPTQKIFHADDHLFCEVMGDIVELTKNDSIDQSTRDWLDFRLKMIEIFKRCVHLYKRLSQPETTSKTTINESDNVATTGLDTIVPGFVLRKFLNNKRIIKLFKINETIMEKLHDLFIRYENTVLLDMSMDVKEIRSSFSEPQLDHPNFEMDGTDSDSDKKKLNEVSVNQLSTQQNNQEQSEFENINPEQIIFSINDNDIIPIGYLDDSLFEIFFKLSVCFISFNKEEIMNELLNFVSSKPILKSTMRPLFSLIYQRLKDVKTLNNSELLDMLKEDEIGEYEIMKTETANKQIWDDDIETRICKAVESQLDEMIDAADFSNIISDEDSNQQSPNDAVEMNIDTKKSSDYLKIQKNSVNGPSQQLSPEKLTILKNQVVTAALFASYTTDIRTEDMLRRNLSRSSTMIQCLPPYQLPNLNDPASSTSALETVTANIQNSDASNLPNNCTNTLFEIINSIPPSSISDQNKISLLKEKLSELGICDSKISSLIDEDDLQEITIPEFYVNFSDLSNDMPCPFISVETTTLLNKIVTNNQSQVSFTNKFNFTPISNQNDINQPMTENTDDIIEINSAQMNYKSYMFPTSGVPQSGGVQKMTLKPLDTSSMFVPITQHQQQQQTTATTVSIQTNTTPTATTARAGTFVDHNSQLSSDPKPFLFKSPSKLNPNILSTNSTVKSANKRKHPIYQSKSDNVLSTANHQQQSLQSQNNPKSTTPLIIKKMSPNSQQQNQASNVTAVSAKNKLPTIDLNSHTDSNHDTALTLACAAGHEEVVKLLLSKGADIEHREKKGYTPLMLAATNGHLKIVDILAANNANLEAHTDRTKDTALSLACSSGRYEVVEILLSRGANKEHRNVSDYTPLSLAAAGGYVSIINLLLSYGAEINSRTGSKLGISPLMLAAMNGHSETTKILLDRGSDINAYIETNKNTALTLACFQGRTEVVNLLLERNANIEHRAKTGLTPLMEAASGGYVDVGRVLLDKGAEVNAAPVPASRDTVLTIAADKGHIAFVELLIKRGANVDAKNKKGSSPLWLACSGGHYEVANLLINAKCDVDAQDNRKVSCLMAAFRNGHVKIVKLMVRHVTQFPSDQETNRYLAICTAEELKKKVVICANIIRFAKERQAAEAFKNAANLLEEIDQERSREESRKAAAARRRERRKQKKKEKAGQNKNENETNSKTNDTKGNEENEFNQDDSELKNMSETYKSNTTVENIKKSIKPDESGDKDETTSAFTIDDYDDSDVSCNYSLVTQKDSWPKEMISLMHKIANTEYMKIMKKKKKASKQNDANHDSQVENLISHQQQDLQSQNKLVNQETEFNKKDSKKNKNKFLYSQQQSQQTLVVGQQRNKNKVESSQSESNASQQLAQQSISSITKGNNNKKTSDDSLVKSDSIFKPSLDSRSKTQENHNNYVNNNNYETVKIHRDVSPENISPTMIQTSFQTNHHKNNNQMNSRGKAFTNKRAAESNSTNSSNINQINKTTAELKREEGWKEVVRKSKKVLVPANAISRVIGRAGCNINTIREISSAHIEVEKQKGQGDRMVIIRGSADATRIASQLITVLSKEADKDLSEIIRELGLSKPTTNNSSSVNSSAISSQTILTVCNSEAVSMMTTQIESMNAEPLQITTANSNYSISNNSQQSGGSNNRQACKSVGRTSVTINGNVKNLAVITNTKGNSIPSPGELNNGSNSNSNNVSNAKNIQSVMASGTSNTVSYTMAVNSKTRSINSSSSSNNNNNSQNKIGNGGSGGAVKIMSAVYKPSNKSQMYANRNQTNHINNQTYFNKIGDTNNIQHQHQNELSSHQALHSPVSSQNHNDHQPNKNVSEVLATCSSGGTIITKTTAPIVANSQYGSFNNNFANNIGSKSCNEKLNFASVAAGGVSNNGGLAHATSSSLNSSKANQQEYNSSDEKTMTGGYNRQFVSPNSFSSSSNSSFSTASLSIQTSTTNVIQQQNSLSSTIGHVRSAPCTPPISNYTSPVLTKLTNQQQQQSSNHQLSEMMSYSLDSNSQQMISSMSNKLHHVEPFMSNSSSSEYTATANMFQQPTNMNTTSHQNNIHPSFLLNSVVNSNDTSAITNHLVNQMSSPINRATNNFMENRPITPSYQSSADQTQLKSGRSNLNPNAPDFASRSNSFSTNTMSQPSLINLNLNNMSPLNNLNAISGATLNNLANIPNNIQAARQSGFVPGNAPPISNDVRQMIVNYSMNVFQNQVPKRHQEAAARLAHLSAQSSNFVQNDMQSLFNSNQMGDKLNLIQYMYQTPLRAAVAANNANSVDSYQMQAGATTPLLNQMNHSQFRMIRDLGTSASAAAAVVTSINSNNSTFSISNYGHVPANNAYGSSNSSNSAEAPSTEDSNNSTQKIKQPAPIGTERAQRKNPSNHVSAPISLGCFNSLNTTTQAVNSNSLFADHRIASWSLDNEELAVSSDSSLPTNTHLPFGSSLGNSDFNDIFPTDNSFAGLLNQFGGVGGGQQQRTINANQQQPRMNSSLNEESVPTLDHYNSMSSNFKLLISSGQLFNHTNTTGVSDQEYWSSTSCPLPKTSVNNTYDSKMQWNNWNNQN